MMMRSADAVSNTPTSVLGGTAFVNPADRAGHAHPPTISGPYDLGVHRHGRIIVGLIVVLLLGAAVAACSSGKKHAAPVTTSTTADTLPLDTTASSATDVYTGSEPRRQLRFHPALGATFQTKVAYVEHTTYAVSQVQGAPVAVPPITAEVTTTVDAIDPDGTIRCTFRFASVTIDTTGVDPATARDAQASFGSLIGITGTIAMRSTGTVTAFTTNPPAGLDDIANAWLSRLSNSIQQLIISFPTDPVGEGAVWKVPVSLDFDGLNSSATYSVTLTHLTTDRIDLELTYAQTAPLGPVPFAGLPSGVTAELLGFHLEGSGKQQSDLTQILPATSTLAASGDILFRLLQGSAEERVDQKLAIKVDAAAG